jgi:hypothetical protein
VLAQQIDAAGRRRADLRRGAEHVAKERLPGLSRSLIRHSVMPVGGNLVRLCWCALLTILILPAAAEAQLAPLGIPRGMFRFEIDGSFAYANERFNDGTKESLGGPGATAQVSTGTGAFTLGIGLTRGLSIFGRLPIVSSWWRQTALDSTANTGGDSKRTGIGDIDAGVVYTFVDHWNADAARGVRLAASGTFRFPTGAVALPADPFGVSLGAGTPAVGAGLALDLGGGTFGARISGAYLLQMSGDFTRRVGSPYLAPPPESATADVTVKPGAQFRIGVAPYYRLARALGIVGSAAWLSQGEDEVQYATPADSLPGVPASILAEGTGASRLLLSIGLTYSSSGQHADGTGGIPLDAGWRWETTVASSGGLATKWSAIIFFARVYAKIW